MICFLITSFLLQTRKAEVKVAVSIVEHNVPFAVADHFSPLLKECFKDSPTAQSFKSACTKMSCIINEAVAPHFRAGHEHEDQSFHVDHRWIKWYRSLNLPAPILDINWFIILIREQTHTHTISVWLVPLIWHIWYMYPSLQDVRSWTRSVCGYMTVTAAQLSTGSWICAPPAGQTAAWLKWSTRRWMRPCRKTPYPRETVSVCLLIMLLSIQEQGTPLHPEFFKNMPVHASIYIHGCPCHIIHNTAKQAGQAFLGVSWIMCA